MSDAPPLSAARRGGLRSGGGPVDTAAPKLAAAVVGRADALTGQPVMDKADLTHQMTEGQGLRLPGGTCPEGSQPGGDTRAGTGAPKMAAAVAGAACGNEGQPDWDTADQSDIEWGVVSRDACIACGPRLPLEGRAHVRRRPAGRRTWGRW